MSHNHPAVLAWRALTGDARDVLVEDIKRPHVPGTPLGKKLVSRLSFRDRGPSVVAKFGRSGSVFLERYIYEKVIPALPIHTATYLGGSAKGGGCWIFLEEISGSRGSHETPDISRRLATWLAELHASAASLGTPPSVPSSGLASIATRIENILRRGRAGVPETSVLQSLQAVERIADAWPRWNTVDSSLPATLVHGDYVLKNTLIAPRDGELQLFVVDWGKSSWGPALPDLANIDIDTYQSVLASCGMTIARASLARASLLGRAVRYVAAIDWQLANWPASWSEQAATNLQSYVVGLEEARKVLNGRSSG